MSSVCSSYCGSGWWCRRVASRHCVGTSYIKSARALTRQTWHINEVIMRILSVETRLSHPISNSILQGAKKVLDPQKSDCKQKMEHLIKIHW